MKTSSRSPKDAAFMTKAMKDCLRNGVLENIRAFPKATDAEALQMDAISFVRAATESMRIRTGSSESRLQPPRLDSNPVAQPQMLWSSWLVGTTSESHLLLWFLTHVAPLKQADKGRHRCLFITDGREQL